MNNFCISHEEDVDGISSAALVIAAKGGCFKLTNYDNLLQDLEHIPSNIDELVLCDMAMDLTRNSILMRKLEEIQSRCSVTYIDHHYLPNSHKAELKRIGIRLIHDEKECASMLTYKTFKDDLPTSAKNLALYGSITDYTDDSSLTKKLMERCDRHFILLESTILSLAISRMGNNVKYLNMLVEGLSKMRYPHEIEKVIIYATDQLREIVRLTQTVKRNGKKMGNVGYVKTQQYTIRNIAKLVLEAFDVMIGVAYREKHQKGCYEVSFMATSDCTIHLGRLIARLSTKHDGVGGGHRSSAGCTISSQKFIHLLKDVNKNLKAVSV